MIKKKKKKTGRRLFDGKDEKIILLKLEEAFAIGASDVEACLYADISPTALYEYQKKNKEFRERKERLKEKPTLKARQTVVQNLDDKELAFKYLIRKRRDEFASKMEIDSHDRDDLEKLRKELCDLTQNKKWRRVKRKKRK